MQVLDTSAIFVFVSVFIALKGLSFYNLFIFARTHLPPMLQYPCLFTRPDKKQV